MSMATLDFNQGHHNATADVLFGDFTATEVATIILKAKINDRHDSVCFGNFSEEEISDILNISHSSDEVKFDFENVEQCKSITLVSSDDDHQPHHSEAFEVKTQEQCDIVTEEAHEAGSSPPGICFEPASPPLNGASSTFLMGSLSTPERSDIDDVLKRLIEEAVKFSNPAQQSSSNLPTSRYTDYSTKSVAWSPGAATDSDWSTSNKSKFSTDFYSTPTTHEPIWSKPAAPPSVWSNGPPSVWSNGSSLFKTEISPANKAPKPQSMLPQILSENLPVPTKDHELMMLGSQLQLMPISHHTPVNIVPRGLINKSTNCFAHAPLQALLVSPLYHVIQQLDSSYTLSPVLSAVKQFFGSFRPATSMLDKIDPAFEPSFIFDMLRSKMPSFNQNGRQEDAEEFLGIILSNIHDEMVSAIRSSKKAVSLPQTVLTQDDGEWQQIGRKNRVQVTRNTSNNESSPVSELFGGLTRSVVTKAGAKESATLQPFLSVQLDIQHVQIQHVMDALQHFTHREQILLDDGKCYRRETLESLPPVLILHLKRFIFDDAAKSCQKLHKEIDFDIDMEIQGDMLSAIGTTLAPERSYHLFGVVYHHGSHATGGHYSAMVYHPHIQSWVNADDDKLTVQDDKTVLKHVQGRSAYLLFYKRVA